MGLTSKSVGLNSIDQGFIYQRKSEDEHIIALAGNPNVGKSTIFNNLTGMRQHTGNWPGKTVSTAFGTYEYKSYNYTLVDLPGTYSLLSHSQEEEIARDYICFGNADAVVVVCDAVCLERNLNLVFQCLEITNRVIIVVNLLDEAKKKHIHIDLKKLSKLLNVPVVGTNAHDKKSLLALMEEIKLLTEQVNQPQLRIAENLRLQKKTPIVSYAPAIEDAISELSPYLKEILPPTINEHWCALKLYDYDETLINRISKYINYSVMANKDILSARDAGYKILHDAGIHETNIKDYIVSCILKSTSSIAKSVITLEHVDYDRRDRAIDKIVTNKRTGFPIMIILLLFILWITIFGANLPSGLLYEGLFTLKE